MKIAEINGCQIHMLAKDHTMVICEPDAVFFRCTLCGEIKSVHVFKEDKRSIPWLRLCNCGTANAPHTGEDTQPLSEPIQEQEQPDLVPASFIDAVTNGIKYRARFVESDHS